MVPMDTSSLKRILRDHYFDALDVRIERIPLGYDSDNFQVFANAHKYVLKSYRNVDREDLRQELLAMNWLRGRGVRLPRVIELRDGDLFVESAEASVAMFEFIAGKPLDDRFQSGMRIARFLAHFHSVAGQYTSEFCHARTEVERLNAFKQTCEETSRLFGIEGVQPFIADYTSDIETFLAAVSQTGPELRTGIVHHDLHAGNFLVADDTERIEAILDFSEAYRGHLVFDLAVLLAGWAVDREKRCLDMSRCRQLLAAYQEQGPISAAELTLLPNAVLLYFATDATGYMLPRMLSGEPFAISQCNMYNVYVGLKRNPSWMTELPTVLD